MGYNLAARRRIERGIKKTERSPQHLAPGRKHYPRGGGGGGILLAKTQEAAQADAYISVKFLKADGTTVYGSAFDATFDFVDGSTAANVCDPRVVSGAVIKIAYIGSAWRIIAPQLQKGAPDCT